jgi:hypothetical protein
MSLFIILILFFVLFCIIFTSKACLNRHEERAGIDYLILFPQFYQISSKVRIMGFEWIGYNRGLMVVAD